MIKQRTSYEIDAVNKSLLLLRHFAVFVEGRLEKAYDEAFSNYYNRKYDGTVTNYYNGSILMGMVTGTGTTAIHQLFSYDSSGNVVSVDYSTNGGSTFTTYYYVRNAQNDVVKLINGSGTTVVEYTYDTWGKLLTTTGSLASTLGTNQPFRYRGYVYDTETGWYYLQSRYYDPSIGRFISADVLLSTGQGVLGHNAFAYCLNNPVNLADASGYVPYVNNYMMTDGSDIHLDPDIIQAEINKVLVSNGTQLDGKYFFNVRDAAIYAGEYLFNNYINEKYEYAVTISSVDIETKSGKTIVAYFISEAYTSGSSDQVIIRKNGDANTVSAVHTHVLSTNYKENITSFSKSMMEGQASDVYYAEENDFCFLVTFTGCLYELSGLNIGRYKRGIIDMSVLRIATYQLPLIVVPTSRCYLPN